MKRLGSSRARSRGAVMLAVSAVLVCGTPVTSPQARADEADACQPDIHRLCDRFFPDEQLVATCLVERRADLSVPCAKALASPKDDDDAD